jgi:elongation factor Ts
MAITAAEVNKLRLQTGAGMMDCKNALVESMVISNKQSIFYVKKGKKLLLNVEITMQKKV